MFVLACGPLLKPRFINSRLEKELIEFKKEVDDKHNKSAMIRY